MKHWWHKTKKAVRKVTHGAKLPIALVGAILLALVLTAVSVTWYSLDGTAILDLSRPGYEQERSAVRTTETQKTYDTTGPITVDAVNSFLTEYDVRVNEINSYGDFGDDTLEDSDIQLTTQSGATTEQQQ